VSDPNKDLIGRIASRVPEPPPPPPAPVPTIAGAEWNAPIDRIQADSMGATQIIRGEIADAKKRAARWEPRPLRKEHRSEEEEDWAQA
jgi:hypothetical protein